MHPFRDVKVWEKSHHLCLHVYKSTLSFPEKEQEGLAAQIRRIATYIPCKISEGCGRGSDKELAKFLGNAQGYAAELEYLLLLARDLELLDEAGETGHEALNAQVIEVQKMLYGFVKTLKGRIESTAS
jgi:four helix bundle protein